MSLRILRRLRSLAVVVAMVVLGVAIVQVAALVALSSTANRSSDYVMQSGTRRTLVYRTLHAAKLVQDGAPRRVLDQAVDALEAEQRSLSRATSSPETGPVYESFIVTARAIAANPRNNALLDVLESDGTHLYALFDARTQAYVAQNESLRDWFRRVALGGSLAIILAAVVSYFRIIVPNERTVRSIVDELSASEERFRSIFEHHSHAAAEVSREGQTLRVNDAMVRLSGYSRDELARLGVGNLASPEDLDMIRADIARVVDESIPLHHEAGLIRKDGTRRDVSVDLIPTQAAGHLKTATVFLQDVSELRSIERLETAQRDRLRTISLLAAAHARDVATQIQETLAFAVASLGLQVATVAMREKDLWRITYVHDGPLAVGETFPVERSFSRHIFGSRDILAIDDVTREPWKSDVASHLRWTAAIMATVFTGDEPVGVMSLATRELRSRAFDEADKDFVRVVAALIGMAIERSLNEERLREMAFFDALTALPNRARFAEELRHAIARADRIGEEIAVLYLDLDGFKEVNDRYGHDTGDTVLRVVAERLKQTVRESDVVARLGGDEFIVLELARADGEPSQTLAARIVEALAVPVALPMGEIRIGASIGIARYPVDGRTDEELLRHADASMYEAKRAGGGRVTSYHGEVQAGTNGSLLSSEGATL